ncbi:MAG TPA: hypothetical protein VF636_03795 [Sphingomonas sp.]|jgi:hypothetical protein
MRLLLLLSALLAAFSSAGASARAPHAHIVQASAGISAPVAAKGHAHVLSAAPAPALVRIDAVSAAVLKPTVAPPRLWMMRRRE